MKDAPDESDTCISKSDSSTQGNESCNIDSTSSDKRPKRDLNACKASYTSDLNNGCRDDSKNTSLRKSRSKERHERFGYNLTRSKSVCDFSAINHAKLLDTDNSFDAQHKKILEQSLSVANTSLASLSTTNSAVSSTQPTYGVLSNKSCNSVKTEKSSVNQQKVSKIVRNRTILGSFPLFYKLSQSLSSLNSGGLSVESVKTSPSSEKYSKLGREISFRGKREIPSLYHPKSSSSTTLPIQPGATLGGAMNMTSSIITEYDMGCFYLEDSKIVDR